MKPVFKLIPALLFLFISIAVKAQDEEKTREKKRYEFFKERNISKTYSASGNNLSIDNQFGEVKITTWDKNEIKVDIHIEASSNVKDMMENTFDNIDVNDSQNGKEISFKTVMNKNKGKDISCHNCSNTMSIDYDIKMPANNKLTIHNSFGATIIPDFSGPLSITSQYGSLTAGKMSNLDKLDLSFGSAKLKDLSNTDVTFSYSSINIDNLSGNNKIKMEFCGYSKIILSDNLGSLNLNDSYSQVHLQPASNLSATYDIRTSYGSFTDKTGGNIKRTDQPEEYGPDLDKHYEGKTGSGGAKITINSSFGSILIGEGTKADMNKKKVRT